jgi:hypothetical protein
MNEIFWRMAVHLDRSTIIHTLPPFKSTLPQLVPFAQWIQVRFESAMYVDGIDRDICPIFPDRIRDDIRRKEHVPLFQLFGKIIDRPDRDLDN